jgi:hypothetical protein
LAPRKRSKVDKIYGNRRDRPAKACGLWGKQIERLMQASGWTLSKTAAKFGVGTHRAKSLFKGARPKTAEVIRLRELQAEQAENLRALEAGEIKIFPSRRGKLWPPWRRADTRRPARTPSEDTRFGQVAADKSESAGGGA